MVDPGVTKRSNSLAKDWNAGAPMDDANFNRRQTIRVGASVAYAQVGVIGFDGPIDLQSLRLYGLPEAVPALLNGTPLRTGALFAPGAGLCFAMTAICVRTANVELPGADPLLKALFSVVVTNVMQTLMQDGRLVWWEPAQLRAVFRSWRDSAKVGALSATGSACWFMGFALAPVALVRAVGQVEILFTLLFSRFFLNERLMTKDVLGALLVVSGVVLVLAGTL